MDARQKLPLQEIKFITIKDDNTNENEEKKSLIPSKNTLIIPHRETKDTCGFTNLASSVKNYILIFCTPQELSSLSQCSSTFYLELKNLRDKALSYRNTIFLPLREPFFEKFKKTKPLKEKFTIEELAIFESINFCLKNYSLEKQISWLNIFLKKLLGNQEEFKNAVSENKDPKESKEIEGVIEDFNSLYSQGRPKHIDNYLIQQINYKLKKLFDSIPLKFVRVNDVKLLFPLKSSQNFLNEQEKKIFIEEKKHRDKFNKGSTHIFNIFDEDRFIPSSSYVPQFIARHHSNKLILTIGIGLIILAIPSIVLISTDHLLEAAVVTFCLGILALCVINGGGMIYSSFINRSAHRVRAMAETRNFITSLRNRFFVEDNNENQADHSNLIEEIKEDEEKEEKPLGLNDIQIDNWTLKNKNKEEAPEEESSENKEEEPFLRLGSQRRSQ